MRSEGGGFCCFHPRELVVGVCAFCLNERLLILASHQSPYLSSSRSATTPPRNPRLRLFRVFHFLHRKLLFRRRKLEHPDHEPSTSHPDTFISMKFEHNGIGSWERSDPSKVSTRQPWKNSSETGRNKEETRSRCVIEDGKRHASLRWRNQMDHLMSWWKNRPNKSGGAACHGSIKVGYGESGNYKQKHQRRRR